MHLELIILEGAQTGRQIPVAKTPVTFGRSSAAGISFPLDTFMSGMHLTVQHALSGIILIDLSSSNGTFLNGERITQAMAIPGDVIQIGTLAMKLATGKVPSPEAAPLPQLSQAELTAATNLMPAFLIAAAAPAAELNVEQAAALVVEQAAAPVAAKQHPVLEQFRQLELPLFCLLDRGADEAIPALLEVAPERHESLYSGYADAVSARPVPCLVQIVPDGTLLRALVEQGWGRGWASFFTSTASFDELSGHFGKFYKVQVEAGEVYFRFYNPEVLQEFLPIASAVELEAFFGPVGEWLLETEHGAGIVRAKISGEGLQVEAIRMS